MQCVKCEYMINHNQRPAHIIIIFSISIIDKMHLSHPADRLFIFIVKPFKSDIEQIWLTESDDNLMFLMRQHMRMYRI